MQFKKFTDFDADYFDTACLDEGTGIANTLDKHDAVYHKKCYDNIGVKEYNRLVAGRKKKSSNEEGSSLSKITPG